MDIDKITIPDGWSIQNIAPYGVVISRPVEIGGGFATIDVGQRAFTTGMCPVLVHNRIIPSEYSGRGWQQKLVDDAVRWLDNVMNK
jgi:hypothetical protein